MRSGLARLLPAIIVLVVATAAAEDAGRRMLDEGQTHIPEGTRATYKHFPPTSGPHWPTWAAYGLHPEPLPPELWVHNLEHGGIVILYHCAQPCPELVRSLAEAYETFPRGKYGTVKLVVSPNARRRRPIAVLAWTWIDEMPAFDRARLLRFYQAHVDQGPEDVP
ncbi:MAG: DUF3105 domain-containing protein [Candidatus Rokubacteria bacterium]|nr:DUF3105 domain-containing protein [Candidatus Rokubacteria bacterium]MBI3826286.1 DUF3105 domain-containing protein [Candidatus Rokubacteria bacterium]